MPRLIVKWLPYFKAGAASKRASNLVRYIATRDGVDHITDANRTLPATKKQKALIGNILLDFPDTQSIFEYEDYERQPTVENASEFISQALERNFHDISDKGYYVNYIAERPGAEKLGTHGLFTEAGAPVVLAQVQREVAEHTGNIWTPIISLRREDAVRLSYDSGRQWQALLRSQAAEIAAHMKIHPDNFRWYAAFHNAAHHPHVHMICWSTDPKEGFLTEQAANKMKSSLARQIFRQDLQHIYEQQTDRRGQLNAQSLDTMREMCAQLKTGNGCTPELEMLILQLSDRLAKTGGKKVYGFLKPNVKAIVDRIVDELAKDERVAACYSAWYDLREEVLQTYHDEMPVRPPLSVQAEFKQIKNMVIAEVMSLGDPAFMEQPLREMLLDDDLPATDMLMDDDAPVFYEITDDDQRVNAAPHAKWTKRYKQARVCLFGTVAEKPDFAMARELFTEEAESGNALAMHDLGRMCANSLGGEADAGVAHEWYAKALAGFLRIEPGMEPDKATYLRYRIGKMHMAGLGTEQDYSEAAKWLQQAADTGHKYAQYSRGSLYYRGQGVEQSYATAFDLYSKSADQENAYASYELGKMYRDGVGTEMNAAEASQHFEAAYKSFVVMEAEGSDDRLQYRIGQMLRDGVGTEAKPEEAVCYFERSAELGNRHAQYALAKMYLSSGDKTKIAAAVSLLQKSADSGNPTAQYVLGKLYLAGDGVPKDAPAAIRWLTESAERGNQFAQYALGKAYIMGKDVERDRDEALRWFILAAAQGNEYAQFFVDHIDEIGVHSPDMFMAATNLLRQLGKVFEQQHHQLGGQTSHIDRKRMQKLREKKIAQGHARDEQVVGQ